MPTSAPGRFEPNASLRRLRRQSGFTLIELMVVIAIIGIATASVGLAAYTRPAAPLRHDADRLVQLFDIAQTEARAGGRPITWESDAQGYRFKRRAAWTANSAYSSIAQKLPPDLFNTDETLRPRGWDAGTVNVRIEPPRAAVFTSEWISEPARIELSDGRNRVVLTRDATGQYGVLP